MKHKVGRTKVPIKLKVGHSNRRDERTESFLGLFHLEDEEGAKDEQLRGRQLQRLEADREVDHVTDEHLRQEVHHPEAAVADGRLLLEDDVRLVVLEEGGVLQLQEKRTGS